MRVATCALILAMAITPAASAADQGKAKGKDKDKTTESKAPEKAKDVRGGQPGQPGGTGSQAGAGSCSPDTTAPVIHSVSASPNRLGPPNHKMTPVSIQANVSDNCPGVTWAVTAIASDEPVNGTGDGDTEPDWGITSPRAVSLRSERAGNGDGRVYTITVTAKDAANLTSTATTTVTVPHNR